MSKFYRELLGEWEFKPPAPSPGRWSFRRTTQITIRGEQEIIYVITDARGHFVAECTREVDAAWICHCSPPPEEVKNAV